MFMDNGYGPWPSVVCPRNRTSLLGTMCEPVSDKCVMGLRLNEYECAIDQELADAAAYGRQTLRFARRSGSASPGEAAALFFMSCRHVEIPTSYRKSDFFSRRVEHCCQISSRSDLNRRSLRLMWIVLPNKNNNNNNNNNKKKSSNKRSFPDLTRSSVVAVIANRTACTFSSGTFCG